MKHRRASERTLSVDGWLRAMRRGHGAELGVIESTITARLAPVVEPESARVVSQSIPQLAAPERFRLSGTALVIVGVLLVGFVAQFAGISQISFLRDQQLAFDDYRYQLANATAPVGQTGADGRLIPEGSEVALLAIPALGVSDVVFEGTRSSVTLSGPGHRRDTPFPGQAGSSVVYGRQSAYGAPFGQISRLGIGSIITATTGQGVAVYRVTGVRFTGDRLPVPLGAGQGRLTLVSAAGLPFLPDSVVRVDASLVTPVFPSPQRVLSFAALDESELTMAGDPSAWPQLVLGLIVVLGALILVSISRKFWGVWQTWIVAVPVLFTLGVFAAQQIAILLPNVI